MMQAGETPMPSRSASRLDCAALIGSANRARRKANLEAVVAAGGGQTA